MAAQADPQSGKCSYIDPLSFILSSKTGLSGPKHSLLPQVFDLNPSSSWKSTFSFGAIWDLFLVEHTAFRGGFEKEGTGRGEGRNRKRRRKEQEEEKGGTGRGEGRNLPSPLPVPSFSSSCSFLLLFPFLPSPLPVPSFSSSRNKSQMAPNEKVFFHEKLGLRLKTWGKRLCFGRESPVFEETMKERGSMHEHFPLCGSARAAIRGRLLKKEFSNNKSVFRKCGVSSLFGRVILGVSKKISVSL